MWKEINQISCGWLRLGLAALVATVAFGFFTGKQSRRNIALRDHFTIHNASIEQLCSTACSLCSKSKVLHEQIDKNEGNLKDLVSKNEYLQGEIDNLYKTIIKTTSVLNLQMTTLRNETNTQVHGVKHNIDALDKDIEHMVNCIRDLRMIGQESHI